MMSYVLTFAATLLCILAAVLLLEVAACVGWNRRVSSLSGLTSPYPRIAVLVPAHNESQGVIPTITDIRNQLREVDRIIVVADNCSDDTASVSAAAGAEVIQRNDLTKIGKGYALDFGLRHLATDPPEVVIVVDADCRVSENSLAYLAASCRESGKPVQALDLMTPPAQAGLNYQVAEFAWRLKNWVRPLGLRNLRLPCQLMGTGMAFPWSVVRTADLANGAIVEDLKLGLDLALAGHSAEFCPLAIVTSHFPISAEGADTQRQRWEYGHLHILMKVVPRYLLLAIAKRDVNLLALVLDTAIPPLSLFAVLVSGIFLLTVGHALLGFSTTPLVVSSACLAAFATSVAISWVSYGRDALPIGSLLLIVPFVLKKFVVYGRLAVHGGVSQWIRTDRKS